MSQINQEIVKKFDNLDGYFETKNSNRIKELFQEAKVDSLKTVNKQLETFRNVSKMGKEKKVKLICQSIKFLIHT